MEAIDQTLRRTADAAARYEVPERKIGVATTSLTGMPDDQRQDVEVEALHEAVLHLADIHGGPHDDGCPDCHAIGNGLAVALAVVRAEVDVEFEQKVT
ncbi:hypothetical protein [Paractinoplanes toevensis]|uniref:Uncharacterized protein n=1 Tax=Paractinoplanes toevensis TaxID=571911 RepID=A0A919VYA7_9ACTN|nr:hypothetical protein [Actinoplanes toevensis]GIM88787.1 hypothetical protein Ato02nite_005800 [Actinoplanes toevensis]